MSSNNQYQLRFIQQLARGASFILVLLILLAPSTSLVDYLCEENDKFAFVESADENEERNESEEDEAEKEIEEFIIQTAFNFDIIRNTIFNNNIYRSLGYGNFIKEILTPPPDSIVSFQC